MEEKGVTQYQLLKSGIDNKTLDSLSLNEYKKYSSLFEEDVYKAIDLVNCVERRTSFGGPASIVVKKQIDSVLKELGEM